MAKKGGKGGFGKSNAGAPKDKISGGVTVAGPGSQLHSIAKGGK